MFDNDPMASLNEGKRPREENEEGPLCKRKLSSERHQRAMKACDACRKSKTKCLKASGFAVTCVRCTSSNLLCLLETEYKQYNPKAKLIDGVPEHLIDLPGLNASFPFHLMNETDSNATESSIGAKLNSIHRGVSEILNIMRLQQTGQGLSPLVSNDVKLLLDAANSMKKSDLFVPSALVDAHLQDSLDLPPGSIPRIGFPVLASASTKDGAHHQSLVENTCNEATDWSLFSSSSRSYKSSPLHIISSSIADGPLTSFNLINMSRPTPAHGLKFQYDIVTCGILSESEVITLMDDFRSNYGRWVLFPVHVSTEGLVGQIRKNSSLLLSACCSLSLRYLLNGKPSPGDIDSHRRKKETYKAVMKHLVEDLKKAVLKYAAFQGPRNAGGDVEFLQAMVILSIYSSSLSSVVGNTVDPDSVLDEDLELRNLNLDPWYLSGLGLSTFISKAAFGSLLERAKTHTEGTKDAFSSPHIVRNDQFTTQHGQKLTLLRIFNHLTLVHLVSCVLSGRMCMVDEIRLNHCHSTLSVPNATNFDGRMVSEIALLLITYNFFQINSNLDLRKDLRQLDASLHSVHSEIRAWYDEWEYLFKQPALQFGEFSYNFCRLQILHNYAFYKALASMDDKADINSFDTGSFASILNHASDPDLKQICVRAYSVTHFVTKVENDSYFAYLSDQIHFFFFYGAMSLVSVLKHCKDNRKLSLLDDVPMDLLIGDKLPSALEVVKILLQKFERVAQNNPNDIITQYKNAIQESIAQSFPTL